jgi:hypothetical protein
MDKTPPRKAIRAPAHPSKPRHGLQVALPRRELAAAHRFIEGARWQRAWSQRFLPHAYCLREWAPEPDFLAMVERIRTFGTPGRFGRRRVLVYLVVDGHRYWCMSGPEYTLAEVLERTKLINRCEVDERGLPLKGPAWLRNPLPLDPQTALPGLERA